MLAEFGAEGIKMEIPGKGDSLRTLGEECNEVPFVGARRGRRARRRLGEDTDALLSSASLKRFS